MSMETFDVMVIGAGAAGLCAAVQAGRAGAKTVLVEKNGICGGTITMSGVNYPGIFQAWGRQVIGGIGWELVQKTLEEAGWPLPDFREFDAEHHWRNQIRIDAVLFAALADRMLAEAGVDVRFHTMLAALKEEDDDWRVTLCGKDGLYEVRAREIVDCTGDANAVHMAGYEYRQSNPCQPATYSVYAVGYDFEKLDVKAIRAAFEQAVARDEVKSEDVGWGEGFIGNFLYGKGGNCNHVCGINACDSAGRTRVEIAGRAAMLRIYRFLRRQKGLENLEFIPKGGECGVRETRLIVGDETVTVDDYTSGRIFPEAVCYSFYPIDLHDAEVGLDKRNLTGGVVPTVPRGALIPRNSHRFLAAGRIISSDRLANSALRIQATCMATGQAAGAIAALAAASGKDPREVEFARIRQLLLEHGAILP